MPKISSRKPYRVGRSRTGLGLFATREIPKGVDIVRYFGPLIDSREAEDIDNRYLFEINSRWTIDGSPRRNVARYVNHGCRPNAESDVSSRKRRVMIRSIKTIQPGEEITYDYGKDYFKTFIKALGCKCVSCDKKRKVERAEARAEARRKKLRAAKKATNKAANKTGKKADKTSVKAGKSAKATSDRRAGGKANKARSGRGGATSRVVTRTLPARKKRRA